MTNIEKLSTISDTGHIEDHQNVRQRLLKNAIELFGRKGYAATSVNEIVSAAGVTKPNLYYYFLSKEGIYLTILSEVLNEFDEIINQASFCQGTARHRLMQLSVDLYQQFIRNIDVARIIYSVYFGPPQSAPQVDFDVYRTKHYFLAEQIIQSGISNGEFRAGNLHEMAMAVIGLCHSAMELELCHSGFTLGEKGLVHVLELLFEGMATNKTAITEE